MNHGELKAYAFKKSGGRCGYCGKPLSILWHLDHIRPRLHGGKLNPENVTAACIKCNLKKNCLELDDFRSLIRTHATKPITEAYSAIEKLDGLIDHNTTQVILQALREAHVKAYNAPIIFHMERK